MLLFYGDDCDQVFGFGRTERSGLGEELSSVRLVLTECGRGTWQHCVCGVAKDPGDVARAKGVCSGDSGGPVLYEGIQVRVRNESSLGIR